MLIKIVAKIFLTKRIVLNTSMDHNFYIVIQGLGTTSNKKNGIFNELGIKGGRGVILKHDFLN